MGNVRVVRSASACLCARLSDARVLGSLVSERASRYLAAGPYPGPAGSVLRDDGCCRRRSGVATCQMKRAQDSCCAAWLEAARCQRVVARWYRAAAAMRPDRRSDSCQANQFPSGGRRVPSTRASSCHRHGEAVAPRDRDLIDTPRRSASTRRRWRGNNGAEPVPVGDRMRLGELAIRQPRLGRTGTSADAPG